MNRVFVDMDGVIADFDSKMKELGLTGDSMKKLPGIYLSLAPIPNAIKAVRSIIEMGYDVFIATKPPTGIAFAYADKVTWVLDHLPELKRKIIITHDKGLLGDEGDFLIDDRPHKSNCQAFKGKLIVFDSQGKHGSNWSSVLEEFRRNQMKE